MGKIMYIPKMCSRHYTLKQNKNFKNICFREEKLKNTLFFLPRAQIHHSFTFNLQFLYRLSKIVCRIFYFRFRFVFIEAHIFVQKSSLSL